MTASITIRGNKRRVKQKEGTRAVRMWEKQVPKKGDPIQMGQKFVPVEKPHEA